MVERLRPRSKTLTLVKETLLLALQQSRSGQLRPLRGVLSVDGLDHVFDDFFRVAEDHHGFVEVEQLVVQASIAAGH